MEACSEQARAAWAQEMRAVGRREATVGRRLNGADEVSAGSIGRRFDG